MTRLPDILETARPSPGVFWPREVGVSGLLIFPIIPFACRFDLVFGLSNDRDKKRGDITSFAFSAHSPTTS
eukprot:COSAG05_NODE_294_length_11993_cov_75.643181_9_plen_71_part_00